MLARAPYRNPQSSFFQNLTFTLFAIAIFALPMLNIVQVQTLLARDDKPSQSSESEPSVSNHSEPVTPGEEENPKIRPTPKATLDPTAITEEEEVEIKKVPHTADSDENVKPESGTIDPHVVAPVDPARRQTRTSRDPAGGYGGGGGITVNEEEEVTAHSPSPPQPEFLPEPTETEKQILSKLSTTLDFPFDIQQETLQGVIDLLKLKLKLAILPDLKAIEEEGIPLDVPEFTLTVSDVKVENFLKLLLDQQNLTYSIEDGVLKITTKTALQQRQRLYIYPLADLVHSREDLDEILDAVENTLRVRGMTGVFSINASTRSLIATHSYVSHQEVLNLLRGLRQVAALTPSQPFSSTIGAGAIRHTPNTTAPTIRIEQEKERDLRNRLRTEESPSKTIRSGNDQNVQGGVEKQPLSGAIPKDSHVEQQKFTQLLMDPTFHPLVLVKEDGSQPVELLPFESVSPLGKDDEGVFLDKNERRMQIDLQRLLKHLLDQLELHQAVTKEFDSSSKTISPEVRLQKIYDEKVEQVLNDKRGLYHSSGRRFSNFSTLISLLDQLAAEIQNETDELCSKIGKRQTLRSTVNGKPVPASPGDPQ